jgi:predicted ATPase
MPALASITIEGFKSIAKIEKLPLSQINLIIGANGSGKSNFISAFSFLHSIRQGALQTYVRSASGANRLLHFGSKKTERMKFHISFDGEENQYSIELIPTSDDRLVPDKEWAYFWNKSYPSPLGEGLPRNGEEAGIAKPTRKSVPQFVQGHLNKWRLYHFHDVGRASPMKQSSSINDNRFLRQDGANLASFLYLMRENNRSRYDLICQSVRKVAPYFEDFILEPLALTPDVIRLEWKHVGTDSYFDVSAFSDGTLRFIALATLFLQPQDTIPSVIIVDEPELGLHPFAITLLASIVKTASIRSQIILSTQSPLLLDQFSPEQVLVANRVDGGTILERLDTSSLAEWLEDYSLGELWEKNEIGGRPGENS